MSVRTPLRLCVGSSLLILSTLGCDSNPNGPSAPAPSTPAPVPSTEGTPAKEKSVNPLQQVGPPTGG
jgi:hypothetical protein